MRGDPEFAALLADRGIGEPDVRALGFVADEHGYGLSEGTPLPFEQAQSFALVVVLAACDDVAEGTTTWEALVDDDANSGAPRGEAASFWSYVRARFSP